jgi:hypothetical protein
MLLDIYVDESCKQDHEMMVIGGNAVKTINVPYILERFRGVREKHNTWGEVKWQKVSKTKLGFYTDFVDQFFRLAQLELIRFHCLYVDTNQFKHKGDREETYNKLMYQLLLHKFGRKYGSEHQIHVYIDSDFTSQDPETMRPMLNAVLIRYRIRTAPFRRLAYVKSHDTDLVQVTDLIVGAVGARKNNHHKQDGAAPHKVALGQHIAQKARDVEAPIECASFWARRFSLWRFIYKGSS